MSKKNIIKYWVDTSDRDYKTMETLFNSSDYHWGLFVGHLVLEKLLKAIYVQNIDINPPRIHDLVRLTEKCNIPTDNEKLDKLEFITRFNLNVRYPDYQQEFYNICTKEFSLDALKTINEVRLWLQSLIRMS
ncbi:MAG: HEPN domain-containing protein [Sedimentisphaerales bacterium]